VRRSESFLRLGRWNGTYASDIQSPVKTSIGSLGWFAASIAMACRRSVAAPEQPAMRMGRLRDAIISCLKVLELGIRCMKGGKEGGNRDLRSGLHTHLSVDVDGRCCTSEGRRRAEVEMRRKLDGRHVTCTKMSLHVSREGSGRQAALGSLSPGLSARSSQRHCHDRRDMLGGFKAFPSLYKQATPDALPQVPHTPAGRLNANPLCPRTQTLKSTKSSSLILLNLGSLRDIGQ